MPPRKEPGKHYSATCVTAVLFLQLMAIILCDSTSHAYLILNTCAPKSCRFNNRHAPHAVIQPLPRRTYVIRRKHIATCLYLVTENDVLEAVEDAEKLWAQALEARKTANALSDRAEEEAEAAAETAKQIDAMFQEQRENRQSITMQQLAQADTAARTNLDAGNLVNRALRAADEADRLEKLAEEALRKSEDLLEQHLKDFPNSFLAQ